MSRAWSCIDHPEHGSFLQARDARENRAPEATCIMNTSNNAPIPRIEEVRAIACAYFGMSKAEMTGQNRQRCFARPRQIAMALARSECGASYPKIARGFGKRDHTTALYAVRHIGALSDTDIDVALHVERLRARIFEFIAPERGERALRGASSAALSEQMAVYRSIGEFIRGIWPEHEFAVWNRRMRADLPWNAPIRNRVPSRPTHAPSRILKGHSAAGIAVAPRSAGGRLSVGARP